MKLIKGFNDGYSVDENGNIYSHHRNKFMKKINHNSGYISVNLSTGCGYKTVMIHRIVAETFITKSNDDLEVNHKDGNKTNNSVNNLEWVTRSENLKHAFRIGLKSTSGEKNNRSKLTYAEVIVIRKLLERGKIMQKEIAEFFPTNCSQISAIKTGRTWTTV